FIDPKYFNRIHFWGKFAGIITILYGIIKVIQSLTSIVGPIPGIISILLGIYLYKSGEQAKHFLKTDRQDINPLNLFLKYYGLFLFISGLLIIAVILFYLVFLFLLYSN